MMSMKTIALWATIGLSFAVLVSSAQAVTLPDHRAYELVTRFEENGREAGLSGVETGYGVPSVNGNAVNWGALGACCGATSAAANLYQSSRQAGGWQTRSLTPTPSEPLVGIFEEQAPMFWTADLTQTIFATPSSFAPGDDRPKESDTHDLYLEGPTGSLTWLSQGPFGVGTSPDSAEFDGATPDASKVVFSSAEQLTANATGLASLNARPQYLYLRDVQDETTSLIDVDDSGALLNPDGASLGNGGWLHEELVPSDYQGTTTHAISEDGSKVFFESPPTNSENEATHLYMRDLADATTTPLDDPTASGSAQYEGASADGSLVFFTSDEGLDGASSAHELYEFNTTADSIGPLAPMSVMPVSAGNSGTEPATSLSAESPAEANTITVVSTAGFLVGRTIVIAGESATIRSVTSGTELELTQALPQSHQPGTDVTQETNGIVGVSAISNDGSHVFFVADGVLASNANSANQDASASEPNLYVYDTTSGQTTFITTLAQTDVDSCDPTCDGERPAGLVAEPDVERPAYPTPDGSVFVFESSGDLTGEDTAPASTLTAATSYGEHTIAVASTAGFLPRHTIAIDTGASEELAEIESVDSATQLTLSEYGPDGEDGLVNEHAVGAAVNQVHFEIYRYLASGNSLTCISCTPAGVTPTGSATLGDSGGGSYAPPDQTVPMSEDGSRIFFDSPDPLLPEAAAADTAPLYEPTNVYEWENGSLSLISNGSSVASALDGTTPSGNDVFFATDAQLVPGEFEGSEDIYDARVDGGFPVPNAPQAACEGQDCRAAVGAGVFFSVPASATVSGTSSLEPQDPATAPSFTVAKITRAERATVARTGRLTLTVTATAPGTIVVDALATMRGRTWGKTHASATLARAGTATLTVRLSKAERTAFARYKKLALRLEVSYSASGTLKIAELALGASAGKTAAKGRHAHA
jgi:hypothetical protein